MKRILFVFVTLVGSLFFGCSNPVRGYHVGKSNPVETPAERNSRITQINALHGRMIVDDWDYLWLFDRSTNLTEWSSRVGR